MALPDLTQKTFTRDELIQLMSAETPDDIEAIRYAAEKVLIQECGNNVYLRGLVEISNACCCDCYYCGIRKSNKGVARYTLSPDKIVEAAQLCAKHGYGSFVLQSGERKDVAFADMLVDTVRRIKIETRCDALPQGLGITLSIGEQPEATYRRLFEAGAHRFLLRIETSNPILFAQIHPPEQRIETRLACLQNLQNIGYQVGTGVMIGLPNQTLENLADDILFFKDYDIDMIGMGPYIPHENTPLGIMKCPPAQKRLELGLLMIAATRLVLRDVNIAATTALHALSPDGREKALKYGANVIMPMMTPASVRKQYQLYPGKPYLDESESFIEKKIQDSINKASRTLSHNLWGDAPHAINKI